MRLGAKLGSLNLVRNDLCLLTIVFLLPPAQMSALG